MVLTRRDVQLRGPPPKDSTIDVVNIPMRPMRESRSILGIRHCLRIVFVAALLFVFRTYNIFMSSTRFPEIGTSSSVAAVDPARVCKVCKFLANFSVPTNSTPIHVRMTRTGGYGRTGNSVLAMFQAMNLGYACRSIVELPSTDGHGAFLNFQERFFDFSQRSGEASSHALCKDELVEGDAAKFWFMITKSGLPSTPRDVIHELWTCMRNFLGICVPRFCSGQLSAQVGVLTVLLRQGDIFPPNFGQANARYQQPFLSYYHSIINFTKPELVLFVGESSNHGPVWDTFELLLSFGATKYDIKFQSSNFSEDLTTMLCARTFVEAKSSLMSVVRLGFANRRFSPAINPASGSYYIPSVCQNYFPETQQVYYVEPGEFNSGLHDNSPEEWVSMLLNSNTSLPRICNDEDNLKE